MDNKFEILRILEIALNKRKKPPTDPEALMMAYARKLADKYRKEGDEKFSDLILGTIGDKEIALATMDRVNNLELDEIVKEFYTEVKEDAE